MSCNILKLLARPRRFERPTFAFGGQRSIQLSYGRLWASIDQTPASGNALDIARYCSIGLCVKAPSAKFGRSNRLERANYCVPRACRANSLSELVTKVFSHGVGDVPTRGAHVADRDEPVFRRRSRA